MSNTNEEQPLERRAAVVTKADVEALSDQVPDLDTTIKTLFLPKADAYNIFPNWRDVDGRLQVLEERIVVKRASLFRTMAFFCIIGFMIWVPIVAYAIAKAVAAQ